ncbi:hypothetical protein MASR2M32_22950 [Sphaerotilus sulfidivorans]
MHHVFIGLGGTGVRVWQALERRRLVDASASAASPGRFTPRASRPAPTPLLIDTDVSLLDEHAPGWTLAGRSLAPPRTHRLLLDAVPSTTAGALYAAHQTLIRSALDTTLQTAATASTPWTVHLVAHPGEPTGAGLLLGVLDALNDLARSHTVQAIELHLTLSESSPLLDALQQRATASPPGFDRCWLSCTVDAHARHERQAQWLLHTWSLDDTAPTAAPAAPTRSQRGEFALWGLAEQRGDLVAVQRYLGHELMLRLLAQLRFDHWRPGLGYVNHQTAEPGSSEVTALPDGGLSGEDLDGFAALPESSRPPTLAAAQREWYRLAAHYLTLVQSCEAPRRRVELRRLFELGVSERFGGRGVTAAFDVPADVFQQHAATLRHRIEADLWQDWRQGRCALRGCAQRVAALMDTVTARQAAVQTRQAGDDRLVANLRAQIDAEPASAPGARSWFGAREDDLSTAARPLQAWAQAVTASAHSALSGRHLDAVQAELHELRDLIDATDLTLAALAREAGETAAAALAPPVSEGLALRLDTREQVQALCKTWVTGEPVQRESVHHLRTDLFTRLGEQAGFRPLAQRLGDSAGCEALLAASTQRVGPLVVASAGRTALLALAKTWQEDPAARLRALQALRASATCSAWADDAAVVSETLILPAALVPAEATSDPTGAPDHPDPQQAALDALHQALQAEPMPRPTGTVAVRLARPDGPQAGGPVWLRQVAPITLDTLTDLMAATATTDAPSDQANTTDRPDSRPDLLLGEALGLVREDIGHGLVLVRLDGEGFEADRVPLGAHWQAAATGMPEPVRDWLAQDVASARRTASIAPGRLRDVMDRRVARVRAAAPPDEADAIGQAWQAAARTAMNLLPS